MPKMTNKRKKKFVITIITVSLIAAVALSLMVTNIFIPVKYLSAYMTVPHKNAEGEMRLSFIDVGYGDCTIVEFPDGKTLLVDGGDAAYSNKLTVIKELNRRGIDTIDYLICTSVGAERCGGLSDILKYKKVLNAYSPYCPFTYVTEEYRSFCIELNNLNLEAVPLEYGVGVFNEVNDYSFCILSPSAIQLEGGEIDKFCKDPSASNINNASAVIWIECMGNGFLLTGNAESEVLDKLVNVFAFGFDLNGHTVDLSECSVIKIPRHGAPVSHFAELMELTAPAAAVLSVGSNGAGFPSAFTISDAQNYVGENFYRTDEDGTVIFKVVDGALIIEKEKR